MHAARRSRRRKWFILGGILIALAALLIGARLYLNVWALDYVNRVLNRIEGYEGSARDVDIDLYRGAYRIYALKLFKKQGRIPVPFIDIEMVDFSVQWGALLHGRIVSDAHLERPVLNFAQQGNVAQTGEGVDWTKPIKELMPIDINLVTFERGKLAYRDFSSTPEVNIYITDMHGEVRNLRNVVDEEKALPSTLQVAGHSIGEGALDIRGALNILRPIPDMALNIWLEKVNMPALNSYTRAYAAFDMDQGRLDLYSEFNLKNGRVSGYVKPIATDLSIVDLRQADNPIQLVWELIVGTLVEIFTNQSKDQFATQVPLEGDLNNIETDMWAALGGIVRNAFIEAFQRGFSDETESEDSGTEANEARALPDDPVKQRRQGLYQGQ